MSTPKKQPEIESLRVRLRCLEDGYTANALHVQRQVDAIEKKVAALTPAKPAEPKYCEDCRWCMPAVAFADPMTRIEFAKCGAAARVGRAHSDLSCSTARRDPWCGEEAIKFEAKPTPDHYIVYDPAPKRRFWPW